MEMPLVGPLLTLIMNERLISISYPIHGQQFLSNWILLSNIYIYPSVEVWSAESNSSDANSNQSAS